MVRVERVELSSLPWEGNIIAVIRHPRRYSIAWKGGMGNLRVVFCKIKTPMREINNKWRARPESNWRSPP